MLDLRSYQVEAIDALNQAAREGVRRPLVVHPTGTGKSQPVDEPVLTPHGWRKIGELAPGDAVIGSSGLRTEVLSVYPQGVRPTVVVTFSDGSTVRCDQDHLWTVQTRYMKHDAKRRAQPAAWKTVTAKSLANGQTWYIPVVQPVNYAVAPHLPIDPYTLGVLLGDGGLSGRGVRLHTHPDVAALLTVPEGHRVVKFLDDGPIAHYRLVSDVGSSPNLILNALRQMGLHGHTAHGKFIPDAYLRATPHQRLSILQGLMDTDGSPTGNGSDYTSVSRELIDGVAELVRSLGGHCKINQKQTSWAYKGVKNFSTAWRAYITLPRSMALFRVDRKASRLIGAKQFDPVKRIVSVTPGPDLECVCIKVDSPDRLYVTNGYALTHNTVTFSHLIAQRAALGRSLVLVHRDELAQQTLAKIKMVAPELSTGIVKAELNEVDRDVVVASVQTVHRDNRLSQLGEFATVIVDECHHAAAPTWNKVLTGVGSYSAFGPLTVGFTATPERDGKSLSVWEKVVSYMSIREAIYGGFLCPIEGQTVRTSMDLGGVRKTGGDYQDGSLGDALERSGAIEEIADAYVRFAKDRKGVAFTPTVKTAHHLAEALRERGIPAEALDGTTPTDLRRAILARLKTGQTQVVANCGVLTEGFDEPSISCVVVARPTKFHGLYVQMVGRGTRLYPGKTNLLVLDVTGASERHDLIAVVDLGLDDDGPKRKKAGESEEQECPSCGTPASECDLAHHRCRMCTRFLPAQLVQEGGLQHETCRAGRTAKVDVFASSRLRWLPVGDAWCLGAGKEVVVMVPAGIDTWKLAAYENGRVNVLHNAIPADWAMGIGEDRAKAFQKLVERSARWLSRPVSDAQKGRLIREGLPVEKLDRVKNSGEAADLVTRIQGRRAVKKLETTL